MTVQVIRSTDVGAPGLTSIAGSFIDVLDYCLVTKAGWTKAFSGVNLAAYKQPVSSNGFYFRVDDTGTNNARITGYETMSDISTGFNKFPSNNQMPGGNFFYKSAMSSSSGPVAWTFITNGKLFYLFNQVGLNNPVSYHAMAFGDFVSYKSGDEFSTILISDALESPNGSNNALWNGNDGANPMNPIQGHYIARSCTGVGSSIQVGKTTDAVLTNTYIGNGRLPYPCPIDNTIQVTPAWIMEQASGRRGVLPGFWGWGHTTSLTTGDTVTGSGTLTGKTLEAFVYNLNGTNLTLLIETSNTW